MNTTAEPWVETGREPMSRKQQKLLNAACEDLGKQLRWHGIRFSKDDYRHLLSAVVLGERLVPGIQTGYGNPGLIRMSRSSLELTKSDATQAIRMAFEIGDRPRDQGIDAPEVKWCAVVVLARFVVEEPA